MNFLKTLWFYLTYTPPIGFSNDIIIFQRRLLPIWVNSTPEYTDYNQTKIDLLQFNNERELIDFIRSSLNCDESKITIDDEVISNRRTVVVYGGAIGWICV
jgi:hypothetical protein